MEASAAWQRRLTALVEPYGFFDTVSRRAQHIVLGAAIFLAVVAVAAIIWVSWRAGVLALATAAAMGVLTPMPCVPATVAWAPGCPTVTVCKRPLLNSTSKLTCSYGGVIQVTVTPAMTVKVP